MIDENTDLAKFWLVTDGLNLSSNLYFGLGKSYFCGHGCKVCVIHDELKALKRKTPLIYNNDLNAMKKTWSELYTFFNTISLDEDPYYFKLNHKNEYQWYLENASICSYATTDNGIFRISKLKETKFKSMAEVGLSMSFIEKVGEDKIIQVLEILKPINQMKFIIDKVIEYPSKIIEWARQFDMPMIVHKTDFATGIVTDFDLNGFEMVQNVNWVTGKKGVELVKIHINSDTILYYNNFYFSNNTGDIPYFTMDENGFDYRGFLSQMLETKQKNYLTYSELVDDIHLKNYFLHTQQYKVNHDFNFIPNFMVDYKIRFFNRMRELGWNATKYGLVHQSPEHIKPIIEKL